jgi:tetratricopeptide (TPR) repeat protein
MAASLIGLISLGAFWWYSQDKKDNSKTAINKQKTNSAVVTNNKKTDTVGNIIPIQPTPPQENASSKNIAENKDKEKRDALFAINFKPDATPLDKEGPLENAFAYYENRQYKEASRGFEGADIGPVTRGIPEDNQKLMAFYIHYYNALSYMAADISTSKAISELKTAVAKSPDDAWTAKAQWYLALAHLKKGETKTSQALLKQVAGTDEAQELKQKAIALSKALDVVSGQL